MAGISIEYNDLCVSPAPQAHIAEYLNAYLANEEHPYLSDEGEKVPDPLREKTGLPFANGKYTIFTKDHKNFVVEDVVVRPERMWATNKWYTAAGSITLGPPKQNGKTCGILFDSKADGYSRYAPFLAENLTFLITDLFPKLGLSVSGELQYYWDDEPDQTRFLYVKNNVVVQDVSAKMIPLNPFRENPRFSVLTPEKLGSAYPEIQAQILVSGVVLRPKDRILVNNEQRAVVGIFFGTGDPKNTEVILEHIQTYM